jgi:hypothetical protein
MLCAAWYFGLVECRVLATLVLSVTAFAMPTECGSKTEVLGSLMRTLLCTSKAHTWHMPPGAAGDGVELRT